MIEWGPYYLEASKFMIVNYLSLCGVILWYYFVKWYFEVRVGGKK